MTGAEMIAVGGGLALGYWVVAVFLPSLFKQAEDDGEAPDIRDDVRGNYRPSNDHPGAANAPPPPPPPQPPPAASPRKWFEVLEVGERATQEEIVAAYKLKISQYHPDKVSRMGVDIKRLAESRSKEINAAYDNAMKLKK